METMLTYVVFNLMFNTSFELTKAYDAGVNAQQLSYPVNADDQNVLVYITFVKFDDESQKNMNMIDSELVNYVKSTFLGTSKPAEKFVERQLFEKKSTGEQIKTKIPVPSTIEIHLITLKDNTKYALAFKASDALNTVEFEKMITEIVASLKEKN